MPGFLISNIKKLSDLELKNVNQTECIIQKLENVDFVILRNTLKKFWEDKLFFQDEDHIIITEGILLNKTELLKKYQVDDLCSLIKTYLKKGEGEFFKEFVGSFSGAVYLKKEKRWCVWTNQTGENTLFYYKKGNFFIIGSQLNYIFDALRLNKEKYTLNEEAIYSILTYGYMYDSQTYAKEIKRLLGGEYLTISKEGFQIKKYFKLNHKTYNLKNKTEDEIIELLDEKFRHAIQIEYDKDLEYGYEHLTDISGGLDSRMNFWVAFEMGYRNITMLHYSNGYSSDEKISKEIAQKTKSILMDRQLDDFRFLYDIDKIVEMNWGLTSFHFITGGQNMLENLNMHKFGVEHTGMIGDVVIGSFLSEPNEKIELAGLYSEKLKNKINLEHLKKFNDKELYMIQVRGLLGACGSIIIRRNYTEVFAPFLEPDFLQFCLSIPVELRANHSLYKKWIVKKYPNAAAIRWQKTESKLTDGKFKEMVNKVHYLGVKWLLQRIGLLKKPIESGMNPLDYWYQNSADLQKNWQEYFEKNIGNKILSEEIKNDLKLMFYDGNTCEKGQALTVLSVVSKFF